MSMNTEIFIEIFNMNKKPILAIGDYKNNAELIEACFNLGYIQELVLDCTYGYGKFWVNKKPENLVGTDIDPEKSLTGHSVDFCNMPFEDLSFQTVVFDPPYKLNGTPTFSKDERYGVHTPSRWQDRHSVIEKGISECVRVLKTKGYLLLKCQDQVVAGKVRWQTHLFSDYAEKLGCALCDKLHLVGGRPQPSGRSQIHARRNYSTLLILQKE